MIAIILILGLLILHITGFVKSPNGYTMFWVAVSSVGWFLWVIGVLAKITIQKVKKGDDTDMQELIGARLGEELGEKDEKLEKMKEIVKLKLEEVSTAIYINPQTPEEYIKVIKKATNDGFAWELGDKLVLPMLWDKSKKKTVVALLDKSKKIMIGNISTTEDFHNKLGEEAKIHTTEEYLKLTNNQTNENHA